MLNPLCKDAVDGFIYALPHMQTMGDRIRLLRNAKGLNQEELGRLCGVTGAAVSMWENGATANIKSEPLFKLLRTLGTDLAYLIYGPDRLPAEEVAAQLARTTR